jgi:L-malate glycosyltransferase
MSTLRPARNPSARILFHVDYLWRGGLEKRVANLALGLDRSRFEPIVSWARRWGEVGRRLAETGVHVVRIDPRGDMDAVVEQIRDLRLDILHSFSCTPRSDLVLGARMAGVPVVLTSRTDVRFWDPAETAADFESERNAATDRIIACSRAVAATCIAVEGVPPNKVTVIHNGVGLRDRRPGALTIREELGLGPDALLVGYAATYRSIKAHEVLLRAFREVVDRQALAHLICFGEEYDDTRARLQSLLEELDLGGHVSLLAARSDVDSVYRGLDVYTHPSFSEGFSSAILEAMAHGLPVVASSVGGTPEAVDEGITGVLVPPGDRRALSTAIFELLADPARRRAFGAAGLDRVRRRFSVEAMIRAHEDVYSPELAVSA